MVSEITHSVKSSHAVLQKGTDFYNVAPIDKSNFITAFEVVCCCVLPPLIYPTITGLCLPGIFLCIPFIITFFCYQTLLLLFNKINGICSKTNEYFQITFYSSQYYGPRLCNNNSSSIDNITARIIKKIRTNFQKKKRMTSKF